MRLNYMTYPKFYDLNLTWLTRTTPSQIKLSRHVTFNNIPNVVCQEKIGPIYLDFGLNQKFTSFERG